MRCVADADTQAPIRHDALWDWASVSKQFTAAAILKLAMKKKLKLSEAEVNNLRSLPMQDAG